MEDDLRLGVVGILVVLALICMVLLFIHMLIAIVTYKRIGAIVRIFLLGLFTLAFAVFLLPENQKPQVLKNAAFSVPSSLKRGYSRSRSQHSYEERVVD